MRVDCKMMVDVCSLHACSLLAVGCCLLFVDLCRLLSEVCYVSVVIC